MRHSLKEAEGLQLFESVKPKLISDSQTYQIDNQDGSKKKERKDGERQKGLEQAEINLRQTLKKSAKIPLQVETFYWIYAFYSTYCVCRLLASIPFVLFRSIINVFLNMSHPIFGVPPSRHTCLFAVLIIFGYAIIIQDLSLLDVSYLYHSFRGQSSLKLYGVYFALQVIEKLMTMLGIYFFQKLEGILSEKQVNYLRMVPEVFGCFCYTLLHCLVIYLDFILYIIVLNSSMHNFIMFCFIINLAKLKNVAFKKYEKAVYRGWLTYDARDRIQKMIYVVLFRLSSPDTNLPLLHQKLIIIILIGSVIDYTKNIAVLAQYRKQTQIRELRADLCDQIVAEGETVLKCLHWDFTVVPFTLFVLKMFSIILWANQRGNHYRSIITNIYLILLVYVYLLAPRAIAAIRHIRQQKLRRLSNLKSDIQK